jgi:hypothetical protein
MIFPGGWGNLCFQSPLVRVFHDRHATISHQEPENTKQTTLVKLLIYRLSRTIQTRYWCPKIVFAFSMIDILGRKAKRRTKGL